MDYTDSQLNVFKGLGLYSGEITSLAGFNINERQAKEIDESINLEERRKRFVKFFPDMQKSINYFFKKKTYGKIEKILKVRILSSISNHCTQNGFNSVSMNEQSLELLLGYTLTDLKKHLESKFKNGISWENLEDWHIDHILPKSHFKFKKFTDNGFLDCWGLENLQPLLAKDNLKKSNNVQPHYKREIHGQN